VNGAMILASVTFTNGLTGPRGFLDFQVIDEKGW